jgi:hypothetical protein
MNVISEAFGRPLPSTRWMSLVGALLAGCLALWAVVISSPASGVAGFGDVAAETFYTPAVQWMVDHDITTGTSATCFSPDDPVTRAQAAAFIWRVEGEPAAPAHPFDDVVAGWQQGAVSWMADAGITTGTSPATFSPDDPVTRGQVAAFLHRLAGRPAAAAHPFTDVARSWQQAPVAWMTANQITTGTSPTTFSPEATATRGQMATILYRYKGSPPAAIDLSHPTSPSCARQVAGPDTGSTTTTPGTTTPGTTTTTTAPTGDELVVAFIGDQRSGSDARDVLELIRDEGATMVLHQGDFDYGDDPVAWDGLITDVLGDDFPYFATVGNHDTGSWAGPGGYQEKLAERLARVPDADCSGNLGVKASCEFHGLFFILSGVGTLGSGHATFIENELAGALSDWRICTWHKLQKEMQIGGKNDEVGWEAYEACREGGAIIATGHEHSYERTKTLLDMSEQTLDPAWPQADEVRVAPGATFAFVSGLGGRGVRDQELCLPTTPPYGCAGVWASIYAAQQGATHGALFCSFGVEATADEASCWFKDVDGNVPDAFTVTNQN